MCGLRAVGCSGFGGMEEEEEAWIFNGRRKGFGWLSALDSLTLFWTTKGDRGGNEVLVLCRRDGVKRGGFFELPPAGAAADREGTTERTGN